MKKKSSASATAAKSIVRKSPKRATPAKTAKPVERKVAAKPVAKPAAKPVEKPVFKSSGKSHTGVNGTPVEPIKFAKSPMTRKELNDYRKLLLEKKREITGDMKSMSHEALKGDSANLSHMPLHMADVGSDNYEQELTLGLVESERKILEEIDAAIRRIEEGTFGVCQATGKIITKARLTATPWAKHSIEAAREMERGRRF